MRLKTCSENKTKQSAKSQLEMDQSRSKMMNKYFKDNSNKFCSAQYKKWKNPSEHQHF